MSGLIEKNSIASFKRLLFRATKGKVLTKICEDAIVNYSTYTEIHDNNKVHKSQCVYILVLQDTPLLKAKILKVKEIFCDKLY